MRITSALAAALAATALSAQNHVVPPAVAAGFEGSSGTGTLWSTGASATTTGNALRQQMIYGRATLPPGAITITRLYWRANGGAATTAGGTWSNVTINLCTSATPHTAPSATFATNLGGDLTNVYTGPVTVQAATQFFPGAWYVDVPLTTPFVYAGTGDLLVEVSWAAGTYSGGAVTISDYHIPPGTPAARVYSNTAASPTGSVNTAAGIVLGFDYTTNGGAALSNPIGAGCYDSSLYEYHSPARAFDLSNSAVRFTPNGMGGYTVTAIPVNFVASTTAALAPTTGTLDDGLSAALTLPFTFTFPGGSTTQVRICTNGFVWLDGTSTVATFAATPAALLSGLPRLCPAWTDWNANPASTSGGGSIHFDVDPSNTFATCTWNGIAAFGWTAAYGGPVFSTFQAKVFASGAVEYHYLTVNNPYTIKEMIVGYKANTGTGADTGSKDLSVLLAGAPLTLAPGTDAGIRLAASARPILGNTFDLVTTNIPATAFFTGTVVSLGGFPGGIELSSFGMPGCCQYVDLALSTTLGVLFTNPTITQPLSFPNDPAFTGLPVFAQAVSFVPGVNPLGGLTTNGVHLVLGTN